ncbi:MAG TPA: type II secretion system F family protein [Allosphingosinicella sp.]|nr:type II secretion system F family protein [Allosphingosinicella sp.]
MSMFSLLLMMIGILGALGLTYAAFAGPSAVRMQARRLEQVRERHSASTEVAAQVQLKRILASRQTTKIEGFAQQFIPRPALLRQRIQQTGRTWSLGHYALVSLGIGLIVATLLALRGLPIILSIAIGLLAALGLPHFVVGRLIKRRVAQFNARFPDGIELMVRGLRSGLPVSETMQVVAAEVKGPVGFEFQNVSDRMKIGRTMEVALQETADRLGTPEFQFFTITLAIQRETGGNLAETLANLSDVLRKRAAMKLKIRAMSSESKASAYIVGALPFIVFTLLYMIAPDYIGGFFVEQRLMIAGFGALVWMTIGILIMAKMVSFEI